MAKIKKEPAVNWWKFLFKAKPGVRKASLGLILVAAILSSFYLVYNLLFFASVYPNVSIGEHKFGGLELAQTTDRLEQLVSQLQQKPIVLVYKEEKYEIAPVDIDWSINVLTTAQKIYGFGRDSSRWQNFLHRLSAPFYRWQIEPEITFDEDLLEQKLAVFTDTVSEPPVDAAAEFVGDKIVVTNEKSGQVVDEVALKEKILKQWSTFSSETIVLNLVVAAPTVLAASVEDLTAQVEALMKTDLTLTWENGGRKVLSKSEIRSLIGFTSGEMLNQASSGPVQRVLRAEFTRERVEKFLAELASRLDRPAKDPKLIIKDGVLAVAEPSRQGRVIDHEASTQAIFAALKEESPSKVAVVTFKDQSPVVHESRLEELGIKELVGRGETNFAGSPVNRRHNIAKGVSFLQSALIAPGTEFSTVKLLGRVDNTTGYLPELVIKENRTVPEYGGGLCQVSTTLFRSALNAGLKITERRNHSYRVSYYEPPIGLDATIYLPKPDFRFLNDTPAYLLLQGYIVGNRIVFELWGTRDGRVASVSTPQVFNFVDPPPPIYVETDTLPRGEQKQLEKAHQGATAIVHYTVTRDGQVLHQQTFRSVYRAWAARFLVGTRDDAPPPSPEGT